MSVVQGLNWKITAWYYGSQENNIIIFFFYYSWDNYRPLCLKRIKNFKNKKVHFITDIQYWKWRRHVSTATKTIEREVHILKKTWWRLRNAVHYEECIEARGRVLFPILVLLFACLLVCWIMKCLSFISACCLVLLWLECK